MNFFTIGVYGYSEDEFFSALIDNNISFFVDIRQRRAVRGKEYSFVNSSALQKKLSNIGIEYRHIKELAPSPDIRNAQKQADLQNKVSKLKRSELGEIFKTRYEKEILNKFNFDIFIKEFSCQNINIVLFCVESTPAACHRGLVANKLTQLGYTINHIIK